MASGWIATGSLLALSIEWADDGLEGRRKEVRRMMHADVGDQLVEPGPVMLYGEIVGMIIQVHGDDGGPPFTVRWYNDASVSEVDPDPRRYWIRCNRSTHEVRVAAEALHRFA